MKFSIITTTFNSEATIVDVIRSLSQQDYPRDQIEWIVVDGESTDRTLELIQESAFRPDRLLSEPDDGVYDAFNKGVRLATGDVVGFLHADDFLASPLVLKRVACAFENSGAEAVYGNLQYVKPLPAGDFAVVRHWDSGIYYLRNLKWGWMPPHPALYLRRDVYERTRNDNGEYFDTRFTCAADYEYMLRILSKYGIEPAYLNMVLVKMRIGGISNRSFGNVLRKMREDWQVIREHRIGGIHTLAFKNLSKVRQFFRHGT